MVRPHPSHYALYHSLPPNIKVIPKEGRMPDDKKELQLFYDTVYHSLATVGVNTSGMTNAIVAGKKCITVLCPEFNKTQQETRHFKNLLESGALEIARSIDDFPILIENTLRGQDPFVLKREAFVKNFIRPRGYFIKAGEIAVREIEELVERKRNSGWAQ